MDVDGVDGISLAELRSVRELCGDVRLFGGFGKDGGFWKASSLGGFWKKKREVIFLPGPTSLGTEYCLGDFLMVFSYIKPTKQHTLGVQVKAFNGFWMFLKCRVNQVDGVLSGLGLCGSLDAGGGWSCHFRPRLIISWRQDFTMPWQGSRKKVQQGEAVFFKEKPYQDPLTGAFCGVVFMYLKAFRRHRLKGQAVVFPFEVFEAIAALRSPFRRPSRRPQNALK